MNKPFEVKKEELSKYLLKVGTKIDEFYMQERLRVVSSPAYKDLIRDIETRATILQDVPEINSNLYKLSKDSGNREIYENPYDARRIYLSLAVFLVLAGKEEYLTIVEKYLVAICDEDTWVVPAHDERLIDIYSAETTLTIAETILILKDKLPKVLVSRVYKEIQRKVFDFYEKDLNKNIWYNKGDNWNSVCNSCIGTAYLLLEKNQDKLIGGISTAIRGLKSYIYSAFKEDGGTDEGVLYWNYGMGMFVIFAEHLFNASSGSINLFSDAKFNKIAEFPTNMLLDKELFISFSDSLENGTQFNPGYIQKIASRTGNSKILGLLSYRMPVDHHKLPNLIRYCTWWNGKIFPVPKVESLLLPDSGIAKLVAKEKGYPIIISVKSGNNGESHNHNDIGSWILTIDGENFFTDPGPGKYSGDYFSGKRYENIFANSWGHSIPVIDGELQSQGSEYFGTIDDFSKTGELFALMNLTNAYSIASLKKFTREILIDEKQNNIILTDAFSFSGDNHSIEEAFVTFSNVEKIDTQNIIIRGEKHSIKVTINLGEFKIQELLKDSLNNNKTRILKRISAKLNNVQNSVFILTCKII
jgi:hypothetical protein